MHWEPDVGLDPGSPGSRPGPKAGAKPLRHPGIPKCLYLKHSLGIDSAVTPSILVPVVTYAASFQMLLYLLQD